MTSRPSAAALALLERLVAFDTTSHRSNLEAIAFIRQHLEGLGAVCRLTHDDSGRKANLYATLGPADRPGVMLSGHTDVVPVEGQAWTSDPFRLVERDGCFYGRGSADMKGFIALCLALAPEFATSNTGTPLHFSFSYDEEIGCVGVRRLIADMAGLPVRPKLCIVGEPTGMKVVAGHKGKRDLLCRVHGRESHSALDQGVNAVDAAAQLVVHIKGIQDRLRREGPFDPAYEPPYSTLHTGVLKGGTAVNITPKECQLRFEIRVLPTDDAERLFGEIETFARQRLIPDMQARAPEASIDFAIESETKAFDQPDDHPAVRFVTALTGDNRTGRVSFGTEAGLFNDAGVPTVVCGPGHIAQAHKPDEFIAAEQLVQGEAFLRRLLDRMRSGAV